MKSDDLTRTLRVERFYFKPVLQNMDIRSWVIKSMMTSLVEQWFSMRTRIPWTIDLKLRTECIDTVNGKTVSCILTWSEPESTEI